MLAVLAAALVFGRLPLPGGDSFGYNSFARNVVVAAIVAHAIGAPRLRLRLSPVAAALLIYLAVAALSVLVNAGSWADVRLLATGAGMFLLARAVAVRTAGAARLVDGLGAVTVGMVLREIASNPLLLTMSDSLRLDLVTDHPNTLGYALAVLFPLFLGGAAGGSTLGGTAGEPAGAGGAAARARCALYAVAAAFGAAITFSRAAWLAVTVSAIAIAAAATRRRLGSPLVVALLGLAVAIAVAAAVGQLSVSRSEADLQRLRIMEASLTLFREHWPLGVGFGTKNLERLFPGRYIELFGSSLFLFHSHNFYVDALTGTGVAGAAAAAWLVARLAGLARRAVRAEGPALAHVEVVACVATIATFLGIALVDMPFYHGRLTILAAVALALIERRVESAEGERPAIAGSAACP